tara:strand:- start:639 stop:1151 length:513 start_codon:yes stop_codon:yes gene_type:complete
MNNKLLTFSLLIFLQVFVLNKIIFFDFLILSPLIIILLLYTYKKNSLKNLLFGFFIGLVVDIFNDSLGVYSMVSITIVYFRNFWILKILGEEKTSELDEVSMHELGNFQYFIFSYPVILLYFTLLAFLEASAFLKLDILAFILLSSSLNYVFMLVFQYLFLESKLSDEWG